MNEILTIYFFFLQNTVPFLSTIPPPFKFEQNFVNFAAALT